MRLEQEINQLTIDNLNKDVAAQQEVLRIKQTAEDVTQSEIAIEEAKLRTIQANLAAEQQRQRVLLQNLDLQREEAEIRKEELSSLISANNTLSQVVAINKRLTSTVQESVSLRANSLQISKRELRIREQQIAEEIKNFEINEETLEQNKKRRRELEAQLLLIQAQTQELQRQELIFQARDLAATGRTFTEEGGEVFGRIFRQALQDGARDLKSTLESLGQGFANTIISTLDAAVEELLTTGSFSRFGRTLKEAVKEGLREVFGEAIRNRIREALAGIFQGLTTTEQIAQAQRKDLIDKLRTQSARVEANTRALEANTNARKGLTPASAGIGFGQTTTMPSVFNTDSITDTLDELNSDIKIGVDSVIAAQNVGNETAKQSKEIQEEGFSGLVDNINSLLGSIFGGDFSEAGDALGGIIGTIGTVFGFASGGIMKGRKKISEFGDGALVSSPQLAVIGEGSKREAVVPLPNNKEIPVEMRGEGGDNINITQSFDFRNADADVIPKLRAEARNIENRTINRVFEKINQGGKYAKMSGRR